MKNFLLKKAKCLLRAKRWSIKTVGSRHFWSSYIQSTTYRISTPPRRVDWTEQKVILEGCVLQNTIFQLSLSPFILSSFVSRSTFTSLLYFLFNVNTIRLRILFAGGCIIFIIIFCIIFLAQEHKIDSRSPLLPPSLLFLFFISNFVACSSMYTHTIFCLFEPVVIIWYAILGKEERHLIRKFLSWKDIV